MKYCFVVLSFFFANMMYAQGYKSFKLMSNGDTMNILDANNVKQGKWKNYIPALRVTPAYEEEGMYKDGKKDGIWRLFDMYGLMYAIENYKWGNKHGLQQYLSNGNLEHEENWRAVDPEKKFDTIDVIDPYNQFNITKTIVKVEAYSMEHGDWRYYDTETGRVVRTIKYFLGKEVVKPKTTEVAITDTMPKPKVKPKLVEQFEKSKKKKVVIRDGATGG